VAGKTTSLTFKVYGHDASASKTLKKVGSTAAGVFAGISAAAVASKIVNFAQDTVDAFSKVGGETMKLQRYMGGTAEDASRLAHAFKMTGIDTEVAAKSLGIFSKFTSTAGSQLDAFQSKQAAALQAGKPFNGVLTGSAAALSTLGVKLRDSNGEIRPVSDLLLDMAEQFKDMPAGVDKTALVMKAFGKNGMALLPFLNKGAAGVKELMKQSDELGTTLSGKDLDAVKENTKAKRTFGEAVKGLQIAVGRELYPALTMVTRFLSESVVPVIRTVVAWMKEHKDIVTKVAVVLGGLVAGFMLVQKAIQAVTAVQAVLNVVMSANPIGLVVIAIAALVAALVLAYNKFDWFRNFVDAAWDGIQQAISTVVEWFKEYVWPTLSTVIGWIVAYYRFLFRVAAEVWKRIWAVISAVIDWFRDSAWPVIKRVIDFIVGYYRFLFNAAKQVWGWIAERIGAFISWFRDTAAPVISAAATAVVAAFRDVWTRASGIWDRIVAVVGLAMNSIGNAIQPVKDLMSSMWDGIAAAARVAWEGVRAAWNATIGGRSFSIPSIPAVGTFPGFPGMDINIPELATGGIVTRPTLALIGEAGPEAIVPLSKGNDYIGGGGTHVHVHLSGIVAGTRDDVARAVASAIRDARARGMLVGPA
jgi:phage-related protein